MRSAFFALVAAAPFGCGEASAAQAESANPKTVNYGTFIALRGAHGRYLVADADGSLEADRTKAGPWETFMITSSQGKVPNTGNSWPGYGSAIALLSPSHGAFVQGRPDGVAAARGLAANAWEQIELEKVKHVPGMSVTMFKEERIGCGSVVALKSGSGKYFVAEGGPKWEAKADRNKLGAWEKFTIECKDPIPYVNAQFRRKHPCPSGQFQDKGKCWSCPSGYNRTVHAVDSGQACDKVEPESLHSASGPSASNPGGDWFWDISTFQYWSCNGSNRTGHAIKGSQACSKPAKTVHQSATEHGSSGCKGKEFHDPRNWGECWECPVTYERTTEAVTSGKACKH